MDYAVLQSLNHDHGPTYVDRGPTYVAAQPAAAGAPAVMVDASQDAPAVIYQQEESHGWRNFFLTILALVIIAGIVAAGVHYFDLEEE